MKVFSSSSSAPRVETGAPRRRRDELFVLRAEEDNFLPSLRLARGLRGHLQVVLVAVVAALGSGHRRLRVGLLQVPELLWIVFGDLVVHFARLEELSIDHLHEELSQAFPTE